MCTVQLWKLKIEVTSLLHNQISCFRVNDFISFKVKYVNSLSKPVLTNVLFPRMYYWYILLYIWKLHLRLKCQSILNTWGFSHPSWPQIVSTFLSFLTNGSKHCLRALESAQVASCSLIQKEASHNLQLLVFLKMYILSIIYELNIFFNWRTLYII